MDLVKTSLEALLQRATNPQNENIDTAAIEAFCGLINKEKEAPYVAIKLIATNIHSKDLREVLQTLIILDMSMQKCGAPFQSEVGKFRFLNEMIKLVSPKYLGGQTHVSVKHKVLQLMYLWTLDYPKEIKIKEAYDMLKKQGVIKDVPLSVSAESYNAPERKTSSLFEDEEKSKLLEKLLQSKNPEDLQAANRLIKNMVKEDEKKAELKSKRISELESVQNNIRLLNEMLESYKPGISSSDELDLIKELHQSCERLRPNVGKLASETQQNEEILAEILHANDDLDQVLDKYTSIIMHGKIPEKKQDESNVTLLDLTGNASSNVDLLQNSITITNSVTTDLDALCDIFHSTNMPNLIHDSDDILQPIVAKEIDLFLDPNGDNIDKEKANSKLKALEDLDALGEHMLKENLQSTKRIGPQFNKIPDKVPMNLLVKQASSTELETTTPKIEATETIPPEYINDNGKIYSTSCMDLKKKAAIRNDQLTDEVLVHISSEEDDNNEEELISSSESDSVKVTEELEEEEPEEIKDPNKPEIRLKDIYVEMKKMVPSSVRPIVALKEENGICVTFHFTRDRPRHDVAVLVLTITSKNPLPLEDVIFRAKVPKECKVRLQEPSSFILPAHTPYLPPAAITQVILLANPEKVDVCLNFIVSYMIADESITEMGEIPCLPKAPYK